MYILIFKRVSNSIYKLFSMENCKLSLSLKDYIKYFLCSKKSFSKKK